MPRLEGIFLTSVVDSDIFSPTVLLGHARR